MHTGKKCTRCKEFKPTDKFSKNSNCKDSLSLICKECISIYNKSRYIENKQFLNRQAKLWRDSNKEKLSKKRRLYYKANRNKEKEYNKNWQNKNKEELTKKRKEKYLKNRVVLLEKAKIYYYKNRKKCNETTKKWNIKNKAKRNDIRNKYRASKLKAVPPWLTKDQLAEIANFYKQAKQLEKETGLKYHVDHIIPLQGKDICGLHVPWNLQVLTAEENTKKGNSYKK